MCCSGRGPSRCSIPTSLRSEKISVCRSGSRFRSPRTEAKQEKQNMYFARSNKLLFYIFAICIQKYFLVFSKDDKNNTEKLSFYFQLLSNSTFHISRTRVFWSCYFGEWKWRLPLKINKNCWLTVIEPFLSCDPGALCWSGIPLFTSISLESSGNTWDSRSPKFGVLSGGGLSRLTVSSEKKRKNTILSFTV
jgi:hypothetical protein